MGLLDWLKKQFVGDWKEKKTSPRKKSDSINLGIRNPFNEFKNFFTGEEEKKQEIKDTKEMKKAFTSAEVNLEDYAKDKLANEKWAQHYFKVYVGRSKGQTKEDYMAWLGQQQINILSFVQGQMMVSDSSKINKDTLIFKGTLHKNSSVQYLNEKGKDYFLIRFPDMRKDDTKNTGKTIYRHSKPKAYMFSPIQSIYAVNILPSIELGICSAVGIKPAKGTTNFTFEGKVTMVTESDGIQFFSYPFEKRAKFYKAHPELDKLMFGEKDFKWFANWTMEKKNHNDHMQKYCKEVERILKKLKLEIK